MHLKNVKNNYITHCELKNYSSSTIKNKHTELNQFINFLNTKDISDLNQIKKSHIQNYIKHKQSNNLKVSSIISNLKQIKAFLNYCVDEEYIKSNPSLKIPLPQKPKLRLNGLTVDEVTKILNTFNEESYNSIRNKTIIALMADCGLRAGEITRIKTKDIQQNQINVQGKGNKERLVFVSSALKKILKKYERIRKQHFTDKETDDSYFLNYQANALSTVSIYNLVVDAVHKAQIKTDKRISPHMFRHFYATQSLKAGVDIYTLSRLLGHSDISTTQIYLRSLTDDDLSIQAIKSSPLMNLNKK